MPGHDSNQTTSLPPVDYYDVLYEDLFHSLAILMAHDKRDHWTPTLPVDADETINHPKLEYLHDHIAALEEEYLILNKTSTELTSIVIAGVPESPDVKPSVRRTHDAEQVTQILDTIDSEAAPVTLYRMGRTDPNAATPQPRLLKVVLASRRHQREVLSLFSKLARENKDNDSFQFKHIYVRRSMTSAERDADKQLRDEAKRRRDAGDKCWVYAGRIVSARVPGRASTYNGQPQGNAV